MQKIILEGRLGREVELKRSKNEKSYLRFVMAVNSKRNGVEKATWYTVMSFNENLINFSQYLKKGSVVIVTGDLDADTNIGKDGKCYLNLTVMADSINFSSVSNKNDENTTQDGGKPEAESNKPLKHYSDGENSKFVGNTQISDPVIDNMFMGSEDKEMPNPSNGYDGNDDEEDLPF